MSESLASHVRHLYEVEGLSHRQIAHQMGLSRKKVARLLRGAGVRKRAFRSIVAPYGRLIAEWYRQYPSLKAIQILERLRSHGFTGGLYQRQRLHPSVSAETQAGLSRTGVSAR
jgi:transcriptional regulator with XRE-family HTH domain